MKSGIYCIENIVNHKKYIGQAVNLEKRVYEHFSFLKNNNHYNLHLQRAYNKYGKHAFISKILICCEPFELSKYEQFFVNFYTSKKLYNICLKCVDSSLGIKRSKKSRKLMSLNHADVSGENNPNFGKDFSGENNPRTNLTQKDIDWIRENKKKYTGKQLGEMFNVHESTIKSIYSGKTWKDNTYHPVLIKRSHQGEKNENAKLLYEDIQWIRKNRKKYTLAQLAEMFNISDSSISNICLNKSWNNKDFRKGEAI